MTRAAPLLLALLLPLGLVLGRPAPAAAQDDPPPPTPAERIEQELARRRVTLNFPDTPMTEVVSFLQDITGLNIVLQPEVDGEQRKVMLRLRDVSLKDALALVLASAELERSVACGVLYIHEPGRVLPAPPPLEGEAGRSLRERQLTLNFAETPLEEALEFLRAITGQPFRATEAARAAVREGERTVTLRLRGVSLADGVTLIADQVGCGWALVEGEVVLDVRPAADGER